jgi:hypothetical protein
MNRLRKSLSIFAMLAVMLVATIALARGAPPGKHAFTSQAVVAELAPPIVASVPPLTTGYDVICNLSTRTDVIAGFDSYRYTDSSGATGLSTTVADRSTNVTQPAIVLLA